MCRVWLKQDVGEDDCAACDALNCAQEHALFRYRKLVVFCEAPGEITGLDVPGECEGCDAMSGDGCGDRRI